MMNKRKKYLLGTLFVFLSLIVTLSQVSIWENHLKSTLMKKINQYDWNLNVDELSGNFISTIVMKDLIFEKENSKRIIVDKISINLGIFSSLFGETVFDLIAIEGLDLDLTSDGFGNRGTVGNLSLNLPFHIRSLFIDANIKSILNDDSQIIELMLGGEFNGYQNPELNCDLLNVSLKDSENLFGKFNSLKVNYSDNLVSFEKINGEIFGLPIGGDISFGKNNDKIKGSLKIPKFSFPKELFSKTPLKSKFSNFTSQFNFESDLKDFTGSLSVFNESGLDMRGEFDLHKTEDLWRLKNLSLNGENSNLSLNGIWENAERISCYMNLENLDLSGWLKDQKPTEVSGLFIMDAGLSSDGALDLIDMTLEIVESKLFNQGEISVHGQLAYQDSVLSTVDPVLLLVGDSYITIDGQGDLLSKEMTLIADMEKADIDLINSFLPGNFVSGKATGNLKNKW